MKKIFFLSYVLCALLFTESSAQHILSRPSDLFADESQLQVLVFLSPECPICRNYTLTLNQLRKKYEGSVRFTGIVPGKAYSVTDVKEFMQKYKVTFPVYIDTAKMVSSTLRAKVTPEAFLLRGSGNVYYHGSIDNWVKDLGASSARPTVFYLRDAIDETLQNIRVRVSYNKPVGCLINDY